ncbi:MAG: glycosyltransferase family 39 protein, partial [Thermoleophilaceae bacterium]
MPAVEPHPPAAQRARAFVIGVGLLVVGGLVLRLWGHLAGLPFVYNVDEGAHFVPRAIGMFDHTYDPGYYINPPALTYLFHGLFWVRWGGDGVRAQLAADPTAVFAYARVAVAILAALGVALLAWAAVRLFDRRVALVAAALLAVAFLPVHYGHFALNDAVLVGPVCMTLAGAAGMLRTGRTRDYALAGVGLGLAMATKYTAGIVLVPLLIAAVLAPGSASRRRRDLVLAGVATAGAFLILNPYALFSFHQFRAGLHEQSAASGDGGGKLGLADTNGITYYLSTLLWGLGVVPLFAALGGAVGLLRRDRRTAALLLPGPVLFLLLMGI